MLPICAQKGNKCSKVRPALKIIAKLVTVGTLQTDNRLKSIQAILADVFCIASQNMFDAATRTAKSGCLNQPTNDAPSACDLQEVHYAAPTSVAK